MAVPDSAAKQADQADFSNSAATAGTSTSILIERNLSVKKRYSPKRNNILVKPLCATNCLLATGCFSP
jgi:hypothetical protein